MYYVNTRCRHEGTLALITLILYYIYTNKLMFGQSMIEGGRGGGGMGEGGGD